MKQFFRQASASFVSLILFVGIVSPIVINAENLSGIWLQPDQGAIFIIETVNKEPIVKKIYNYTQGTKYCVADRYNSKAMKNTFVNGIIRFLNKDKISWKRFETSFPEYLERAVALPPFCQTPMETQDPLINLAVLWSFFNEYYANFDLSFENKEQWRELKSLSIKKLQENDSEQALYTVMSDLLASLQDEHVELYKEGDFSQGMDQAYPLREDIKLFEEAFAGSYRLKPNTKTYLTQLARSLLSNFEIIDNKYLSEVFYGPEKSVPVGGATSKPVYTWGHMASANLGYLRILQELHFEGSRIESTDVHYRQACKTIDKLIAYFKKNKIKGLIVDLRYNLGGDDAINNYILQYLVDKKQSVLRVVSFINGKPQAARKRAIYPDTSPLRSHDDLFPIYVLTSPNTVSSGEILAISLSSLPNSLVVGYRTQGMLSDTHTRMLPNGWIYQLPFYKVYSNSGVSYERIGLAPDIEIQPEKNYLMKKYILAGSDIVIDDVLEQDAASSG